MGQSSLSPCLAKQTGGSHEAQYTVGSCGRPVRAASAGDQLVLLPEVRAQLKHFSSLDADGDGTVTSHEFHKYASQHGALPALQGILDSIWPYASAGLAHRLEDVVGAQLQQRLSGLPIAVKLHDVSLGDNAPEIGPIYSYRKHRPSSDDNRQHDGVQIDARIVLDTQVSMDVEVGPLTLGIERISFAGTMCFVLRPLLEEKPVIGGVNLFFMNPPKVDMTLKGLGGWHEVDTRVRRLVEGALDRLLVLPHRLAFNFAREKVHDAKMSLRSPPPLGVLRLSAHESRDLVGADYNLFGAQTSDPYVKMRLGACEHSTEVITATLNPKWKSDPQGEFLVYNERQLLFLDVLDRDRFTADDLLGSLPEVYTVATLVHLQAKAEEVSQADYSEDFPGFWLPLDTTVPGVAPGASAHHSEVLVSLRYFEVVPYMERSDRERSTNWRSSSADGGPRSNGPRASVSLDSSDEPAIFTFMLHSLTGLTGVTGAVVCVKLLDRQRKPVPKAKDLTSLPCQELPLTKAYDIPAARLELIKKILEHYPQISSADMETIVREPKDLINKIRARLQVASASGAKPHVPGWSSSLDVPLERPRASIVRIELRLKGKSKAAWHEDIDITRLCDRPELRRQEGKVFPVKHGDETGELEVSMRLLSLTRRSCEEVLRIFTRAGDDDAGAELSPRLATSYVDLDLHDSLLPRGANGEQLAQPTSPSQTDRLPRLISGVSVVNGDDPGRPFGMEEVTFALKEEACTWGDAGLPQGLILTSAA